MIINAQALKTLTININYAMPIAQAYVLGNYADAETWGKQLDYQVEGNLWSLHVARKKHFHAGDIELPVSIVALTFQDDWGHKYGERVPVFHKLKSMRLRPANV